MSNLSVVVGRLDELGFIWDVEASEWRRNYEAFVDYERQMSGEKPISLKVKNTIIR